MGRRVVAASGTGGAQRVALGRESGEADDAGRISVAVRLFAELRERAGVDRARVTLPDGSPASAVWAALPSPLAGQAPPRSLAFAINHAWAHPATPLHDGDEVVLLLPGSGG